MLSGDIASKTGTVGRFISISAVGGVIAAAMALPVIATTGVVIRDQANKAATPATASFGVLPQRSEILDANGHLLAYVYGVDLPYASDSGNVTASGVDRQPVSYTQIAPVMRQAIVAIEDDRYWQEGALDLKGTVRALVNDLQHKAVQGGSSITQQYVKNMLILSAPNAQQAQAAYEDTLSRKLHELRLAIALAHQESKQQILTGYLNDAYFGNLAYGVEVAAETYFNTSASSVTLPQAALLAGMVENPSGYDPWMHPAAALERRNTVLARMAQTGTLTSAQATAAEKQPLGVQEATPSNGCTAGVAGSSAYFCEYVEQVILHDSSLATTPTARARLLATGGLKIYTTLDPQDQRAATNAVNYWVPASGPNNPGGNADTEAVVQPGTGYIKAIAQDRPYGTGSGQTLIDYAVDSPYGFGEGIQSGSSSKLFTLITALEQGVPFGTTKSVPYSTTMTGFTNCAGGPAGDGPAGPGSWQLNNASLTDKGTFSVYTGTTQSINTFYAALEKQVGLCNVAKTASALGVHRADGQSIWQAVGQPDKPNYQPTADNLPSFTLGAMNVSPLTMAAAYATVADRGTYCTPVAITRIETEIGSTLSVPSADCHQAISPDIADAVNYILQGVLTTGTAAGEGINRPAAGKTGTGNGPYYVDFAGYTPTLASYVSVFNPTNPQTNPMVGIHACYTGGCPGTMFGANAPAQTWQTTFEHANLGPDTNFVPVPANSPLNSMGNGQNVNQNSGGGKGKGKNGGGGGNGNGNGNGNCAFFFCTGNGGGNGGGGGGNNGGPINAGNTTTKALITGNLATLIAREE